MQGIRRTVDPLVHFVKDANEKYATLESVLKALPCFSELQKERESLRERLEKLEANVTLTVEDTTTPNLHASPAAEPTENESWTELLQFLEQSVDAETDDGAKRAFRTVAEYLSQEQEVDTSLRLFQCDGPHEGSDDGLSSAEEVGQAVIMAVDRLLEGNVEEPDTQSTGASSIPEAAAAADPTSSWSQVGASDMYRSSDEDSAEDDALVPYDAGLVDEFDMPISCFVDNPESGTLYEKVGETYEEIGRFSAGELELLE